MKKFTIVIHTEEDTLAINIRRAMDDLLDKTDWDHSKTTTIMVMEDYDNAPSRLVARYSIKDE